MNILHLEMSQFFSRVIGRVAEESGYQYRNEKSIETGLKALSEWNFDLLITAHVLEDGSADTLLKALGETPNRDMPVIIITADDSIENREKFFALGVMDYLLKSDLVPERLKLYFEVINSGGEFLEELKTLNVAVLDDSNMSLHVIRSIFQYYGVNHVQYFSSPRELVAAENFDLYIIDMVMPEMTGDEVLMAINEKNHHCGVIVVSGVSNRLSMAHALALGADDYVSKPFDTRDFMARVKGVVRHLVLLRELEDKSRQMEELAKRDSLTKLWNHGAIHEILEHDMKTADGRPVSVLLFDLDDFKMVNDKFGHQAGDDVLLSSSDLMSRVLGAEGEVGRYGGEEFLAVLPGKTAEEAGKLAEHLLGHFRELDMGITNLKVTASCGAADSSESDDAMKLVELADERLYRAKEEGKDRVVLI
jgi:two-component system cell cycle response regulator